MANLKPRVKSKYKLAVHDTKSLKYVIGEFECLGRCGAGGYKMYCKEKQFSICLNRFFLEMAVKKYEEFNSLLK